jgi:hypothetical protein
MSCEADKQRGKMEFSEITTSLYHSIENEVNMSIAQDYLTISWRFWLFWMLAFIAFPLGGLLANVLVGPITTKVQAALAGAITGVVLGLIQWLVLKGPMQQVSIVGWSLATSAGMAIGLGLSVGLLGSETDGNNLFWRAAITGLSVGIAQWILLRNNLHQSVIWIAVITLGWVVGWFITRSAGIDLTLKWSVFGASGAVTFQFLTGLALYFLIRLSHGMK